MGANVAAPPKPPPPVDLVEAQLRGYAYADTQRKILGSKKRGTLLTGDAGMPESVVVPQETLGR